MQKTFPNPSTPESLAELEQFLKDAVAADMHVVVGGDSSVTVVDTYTTAEFADYVAERIGVGVTFKPVSNLTEK